LLPVVALAAPSSNDPHAQWFTQTLDHFNPQDGRTWQQKFYVNSTFWVPGGPIFFQIGGEGPASYYFVTGWAMSEYAATHNALQVALEHRFYGESRPLPDLSPASLRFLSIEQALADAADFIIWIKAQFPTSGKVVAFGGSYPGALSAWIRIKYPTVIDMSVASSAPVLVVEDMVSFLEVVGRSLATIGGVACDTAVRTANQQIDQMITTSAGAAQLSTMFNTCEQINPNDWQQVATFASNVMGNWMGTFSTIATAIIPAS
jgi:pimeloyl-ACP methyl ester carboxylesterase